MPINRASEITVGIIGGGQLARMTAIAAYRLGISIAILDPDENSPASQIVQKRVVGPLNDISKLRELAEKSDLITLENEFVDAPLLEQVESIGKAVYPSSRTVGLIQDKLTQKESLACNGINVPRFEKVSSPDEIIDTGGRLGWPLILKVRRNAYDGRGNELIGGPDEVRFGWNNLDGDSQNLMAEEFVSFDKELAVIVVRNREGKTDAYPVVETIQKEHICHIVIAPARVNDEIIGCASDLAKRAVEAIGGVGVFGVEMFLREDGRVLINEIAPRPHNSGHYTIEACFTSQYENHVRAILGYPLGSTEMVKPAAVMVNLLGNRQGDSIVQGIDEALMISGVNLHVYSKRTTRPNRKMGHVTVLGHNIDESLNKAVKAASRISF